MSKRSKIPFNNYFRAWRTPLNQMHFMTSANALFKVFIVYLFANNLVMSNHVKHDNIHYSTLTIDMTHLASDIENKIAVELSNKIIVNFDAQCALFTYFADFCFSTRCRNAGIKIVFIRIFVHRLKVLFKISVSFCVQYMCSKPKTERAQKWSLNSSGEDYHRRRALAKT